MTDDRSLERAARSWLEIGPTIAPDRAVEAALLQIQKTTQEPDLRIRWRKPIMLTPARLTALVAVGALVIFGAVAMSGLGGTARSTPTATPASASTAAAAVPIPTLDATYASPRFGYTIAYPSDWTATAGNGIKPPPKLTGHMTDTIANGSVTLRLSSSRIVSTQSDLQWLESYCESGIGSQAFCTATVPVWPAIKFGRYPGYLSRDDPGASAGGGTVFEAVTLVGGRGYVVSIEGTDDMGFFRALIDTMQFDATSAVDLPPLTRTFTSPWYGYSIGTANGWQTFVATRHWVGLDDSWPSVDELRIDGTDSVVDIGSQALKQGQTYDQWLAGYHADATQNTPPGCDGGPLSTWKTTLVGPETAQYTTGCNWATAVLKKGGRAYTFSVRHQSFDSSQQLRVSDFLLLLRSVQLAPDMAVD